MHRHARRVKFCLSHACVCLAHRLPDHLATSAPASTSPCISGEMYFPRYINTLALSISPSRSSKNKQHTHKPDTSLQSYRIISSQHYGRHFLHYARLCLSGSRLRLARSRLHLNLARKVTRLTTVQKYSSIQALRLAKRLSPALIPLSSRISVSNL